jgi:hypothetical protein
MLSYARCALAALLMIAASLRSADGKIPQIEISSPLPKPNIDSE